MDVMPCYIHDSTARSRSDDEMPSDSASSKSLLIFCAQAFHSFAYALMPLDGLSVKAACRNAILCRLNFFLVKREVFKGRETFRAFVSYMLASS